MPSVWESFCHRVQSASFIPLIFCHPSFCRLTCLQSSLAACLCLFLFFFKSSLMDIFSITHSNFEGRCNLSHLCSASFLVSSPPPQPPLLALPHDDTDSAAEIKGRALITDSAKCRPAAQGIRPHYKNSRLRAVMTNHAQQPLGNTEPSLPCCVKP